MAGPDQTSPGDVARLIQDRANRAERARPHVAAAHAELCDEHGRPPRLSELSAALLARRKVERTPRALARDLDALRLERHGRRRKSRCELPPLEPSEWPDLDAMPMPALLALAREAIAAGDQEALLEIMSRVTPRLRGAL